MQSVPAKKGVFLYFYLLHEMPLFTWDSDPCHKFFFVFLFLTHMGEPFTAKTVRGHKYKDRPRQGRRGNCRTCRPPHVVLPTESTVPFLHKLEAYWHGLPNNIFTSEPSYLYTEIIYIWLLPCYISTLHHRSHCAIWLEGKVGPSPTHPRCIYPHCLKSIFLSSIVGPTSVRAHLHSKNCVTKTSQIRSSD